MKALIPVAALLLSAQSSFAIPLLVPARCTHDNLSQWTGGAAPIAGTARGRNEWLKVCMIQAYKTTFPGGFERDSRAVDGRINYPTFGAITGLNGDSTPIFTATGYIAPSAPPASAADASCVVPDPNEFVGLCTSGCVTPESNIEVPAGVLAISEMDSKNHPSVMVPVAASNGLVNLEAQQVESYVHDIIPARQKVLVIKTVSGGEVHVSINHPLLSGTNKMARAQDLRAGDSLVTADGKKDLITSITEENWFGRMYNLTVNTDERSKSLYVVQGYISGDKKFQDEDVSAFNRAVLRNLAAKIQ